MIHITGITTALSESCRQTVRRAIDIAKEAGVLISFDPNLRLKLWTIEEARETLLPLIKEADYFLPGWDELKLLYQSDDYNEVKAKLAELKAISVIKGMGDATVVLQNGEETAVPFYPAEQVVDTVGAGDGFCAGFLAGLMKGLTPVEAVRLASINGSLVVQMRGDWEALPEWSVVEQRLSAKAWVER